MRLYLVQHAEATSKEENPQRPLTLKGREDALKTSGLLKKAGIALDIIWHSSKTRAIETAQIFKEALAPKKENKQRDDLLPNDPVDKLSGEFSSIGKDMMIVGHLPFLQKLASFLLVGMDSKEIVSFKQAGVVCLERQETGNWQLIFEIIPDLIS